jgi:hypothetical protein
MPYNSERVPLKNRTQVCFDRFLHVSRPFAQVAIPAVSKVSLNAELFNTHNARNRLSLASEHSCHSCASHGTEDMQRWFILIVILLCLFASIEAAIVIVVLTKSLLILAIPTPLVVMMHPVVKFLFPSERPGSHYAKSIKKPSMAL